MFPEQLDKINRLIDQVIQDTKTRVNMSLGVCLKVDNQYYMIADTRSVREENELAITVNDCTHKIVKLKNYPMAILITGFNEFTKERIDFEEYVDRYISTYVDELKRNDFVHPFHIVPKIRLAIEESLQQYELEGKLPKEKGVGKEKWDYFVNHANEIIFIYYDFGIKDIQTYKYNIIPFGQDIPCAFSIDDYLTCGYKQAEQIINPCLENKEYEKQNIIDFANEIFKKVYEELPIDKKVVNEKVDILKIHREIFEWIQRQ